MIRFDAAVFDLDGTLLDSLGMWENLDGVFLSKRGIEVTPDYSAAVGAMSFQEAAEYTVRRYGLAETPDMLVREWDSLAADAYENSIPLKPGARDFLLSLRAAGKKLGVATALPPRLYGPALKRNGVYGLFDAFAHVGEVGRGKGFPDIYLLAAGRLGVPPERCVAFEDVLPGVLGAKAAGMAAFGVYDPASRGDEARMRAAADGYLEKWPAEGPWSKEETMRTDGVILDVDGTLWDSTGVVAGAWMKAVREEKLEGVLLTPQVMKGQFGKTMKEIARNLFGGASEEQRDRLMKACYRREEEALRETDACLLYPGVRETMEALSASCRLFIVSNCQKGYIELFLSKNGLASFVTDFECYGNNGNDKGPNIRLIVERNGLRAPVYVGDMLGDQRAAAFAGVPFVFAAYGFGKATEYAAKIDSFPELAECLRR